MGTVEQQVQWENETGEQLRLLTDEELDAFGEAVTEKARELLQLDELVTNEMLERNTREVE